MKTCFPECPLYKQKRKGKRGHGDSEKRGYNIVCRKSPKDDGILASPNHKVNVGAIEKRRNYIGRKL